MKVLTCTCRASIPIAPGDLGRACGAPDAAHELCRADIARFRSACDAPLLVTCTQEAPAFRLAHAEAGASAPLHFVNIRETAGWSDEAGAARPKIAALVARAQTLAVLPDPGSVALKSAGVALIYGRDERALEAATALRDRLDLTVMLAGEATVLPRRVSEFPVVRGVIRSAVGHLGAFRLTVDGFATGDPSSRGALAFGPARDGATSRCDVLIDLTGDAPLFSAARPGYLRADPNDPVGVERLLFAAADLVGDFDVPRPVMLDAPACAHERSGQSGCNRCLDSCPMGAIVPAGDAVAIDPAICAGCGTCAAVCPTDAIRWTVPEAAAMASGLRDMLAAYRAAGGREPPVLLLLDATHGEPLIDVLARLGHGLPARVIPVSAPRVLGLDALAAAFAFGASQLVVLLPERDRAGRDAWQREAALAAAVLEPLGFGPDRVRLIETDDPFALDAQLRQLPALAALPAAGFAPLGRKRDVTMQALSALAALAPTPQPSVALPAGAPFGRIAVADGCTLCLSCVSACPTSALRDDPQRPTLRFVEDNCVQCGLCASTCPEDVISLLPRFAFGPERRAMEVLREAEPALCSACGTPFGVKASIDRVAADLIGKHWMFSRPDVIARLGMCADCRMRAQVRQGLDPYAAGPRPATRTVDDYR